MSYSAQLSSRRRWINGFLVLSSLVGYLRWGGGQNAFFLEIEAGILSELTNKPLDLLHPAIGMPFSGQILLLITLFQSVPNRVVSWLGFGLLSPLILFVLIISIAAGELEMMLSVLPYLFFATLYITAWVFKKEHHKHQGPKSDLL